MMAALRGDGSSFGRDERGAEVRVARPRAASDRLLFANVAGTAGGTTIVFPDAGAAIYNAINGTDYGLTVLPFYDGYWGGVWSGASYSSGTGLTTFTGNFGTPVGGGALGDSVKPGMVVVPDLHRAVPLHIESVNINLLGSDTLTVKGDATGLGGSGTRFRIHQHAPYKYDLTDEVKRNTPCDLGARYLWSSYRRIPWTWSRAGEDPYLAWNRVYLPEIGRWTSTDPLGSRPNPYDYVGIRSVQSTDSSGLESYSIDDFNCTITMSVVLNFKFDEQLGWNQAQQEQFVKNTEAAIKEVWHAKFVLKSGTQHYKVTEWLWLEDDWFYPTKCTWWAPCPCRSRGFTANLSFTSIIGPHMGDDIEIVVSNKHQDQHYDDGYMYVAPGAEHAGDWTVETANEGTKTLGRQSVVAHEFGHWMGFGHPSAQNTAASNEGARAKYKGITDPIRGEYNDPNTKEPSTDIMGIGSGLKVEYAKKWKDELDDERDYCGPYTASLK